MNFEETGAILRSEREKRHLSVDDVANSLKISARQLRAIEAGDINSLPHPVYAKGFIRSYAAWLGINVEEARRGIERQRLEPAAESEAEPEGKPAPGPRALLLFLGICALAGGLYYAWQSGALDFLLKGKEETVSVQATLPSAESYMAAKDAARQAAALAPRQAAPPPPQAEPASEPKPAPPAERSGGQPVAEEPLAEVASPPRRDTAPEPPVSPAPPAQHKLIITAIEECWVHSNADKTDTRQFSLRKGDTFALTFVDTLELKLGNAGGVRLRYDGEDLPAPGTSGQVKTIVFPQGAD